MQVKGEGKGELALEWIGEKWRREKLERHMEKVQSGLENREMRK